MHAGDSEDRALSGALAVAGLAVVVAAAPARADDVSSAQTGTSVARGWGIDCVVHLSPSASCAPYQVRLGDDRSVHSSIGHMGGVATADPAILAVDFDTWWVLGRGTDGALWYRFIHAGVVEEWTSLGGILSSAPAVAHDADGRVHVFARGIDEALWTRSALPGAPFGPWTSLGGVLTSDPDADTNVEGGVDVVARGSDAAVWHRRMVDGTWGTWRSLGGVATSGPSIAFDQVAGFHVAARGTTGAAYQTNDLETTPSWYYVGGILASDPELEFLDLHAGSPVGNYNYEGIMLAEGIDGRAWQNLWPHHGPHLVDGWGGWHPTTAGS